MNGPILLKQLCTVGAILLCLGVSGCRDDVKNIYKGDEGKEEPEKVPNDFDYVTSKNVTFSLKYDVPEGCRVPFEVYLKNPITINDNLDYEKSKSLEPIIEGYTDEKGTLTLPVKLAASVKELYVYSSYIGVPILMKAEIKGDKVEFDSSSAVTDIASVRARAGSGYNKWEQYKYEWVKIGDWEEDGTPMYLNAEGTDEYKLNVTSEFLESLNALFPKNDEVPSFSKYIYEKIELQEAAEVYINYVSHEGARKNALAYFTYTNDNQLSRDYINRNLIIAFPNLNLSKLEKGDVIQLKYKDKSGNFSDIFPKGIKIGFALLVDAFDGSTHTVKNKSNVVYSLKNFNEYGFPPNPNDPNDHKGTSRASSPHMITLNVKGQIVFAFEDQPWRETSGTENPANYKDDVFTITANPKTALPDDIQPAPDPSVDPPYMATFTVTGIWAFEDNWPKAGDYDMNDIVVGYKRKYRIVEPVASLTVGMLEDEFEFLNNGATFSNAFGYVLGGKIKKENVKVEITSKYTCANQGVDGDLEEATIMLFNNGKSVAKGTKFKVKSVFPFPVEYFSFWSEVGAPMNPFIVVNGMMEENRKEIHLPLYLPTSKNDPKNFATEDDCSVDAKYYISKRGNNYPFALDLVGATSANEEVGLPHFKIPGEGQAIDELYPDFGDWVASKGKTNTDWYYKNE